MGQRTEPVVIVMADDDDDDVMFAREALNKSGLPNEFHSVSDGAALLDYLKQEHASADASAPRPELILLDLNMPRMNGLEALAEIKRDPSLRAIPIIMLTTSNAQEDIVQSYELGASSFIQKPVTFEGLVNALEALGQYWFDTVALPEASPSG